jgi:hypothetical protein
MSLHLSRIVLLALATTLTSSATLAANNTLAEIKAQYQKDRTACMRGQTNQDRATCLQEAKAAYDEARKGNLNAGADDYMRNELARCEPLPPSDRRECVRRIRGRGTAEGGVMEGGIYRRIETPSK